MFVSSGNSSNPSITIRVVSFCMVSSFMFHVVKVLMCTPLWIGGRDGVSRGFWGKGGRGVGIGIPSLGKNLSTVSPLQLVRGQQKGAHACG